uniref:Uncharacterized protein n=1 Tax=Meloidogyne hapla TaxID=6305 RepID=A0A1I8BMY9_MELHA
MKVLKTFFFLTIILSIVFGMRRKSTSSFREIGTGQYSQRARSYSLREDMETGQALQRAVDETRSYSFHHVGPARASSSFVARASSFHGNMGTDQAIQEARGDAGGRKPIRKFF